jgi:quercetin dioxygenase-like cupin family protein
VTWQAARIDEIPRAGKSWIPLRKHFGITAFGVNAWTGDPDGDDVIGEHTEDSGHEELYVVLSGRATFTVGEEEIDAPTGTVVFVDPSTKRKAVARDPGTTILSVGAKPGEAFAVQTWEANAEMWPLYEAGDYEGAAALLRKALEEGPDPGLSYNLACMEARLGHSDAAIEQLRQVVDEPRFRELAPNDPDLESIRDDPRFTELLTPRS